MILNNVNQNLKVFKILSISFFHHPTLVKKLKANKQVRLLGKSTEKCESCNRYESGFGNRIAGVLI